MTSLDFVALQAAAELASGVTLTFRTWCPADCWPEMAAMQHPDCRHVFAEPIGNTIEAYREAQQPLLRLAAEQTGLSLSVVDKLTGLWMGYVLFRAETPEEDGSLWLERTLFLTPHYWGRGIAAEVDRLTCDVLFAEPQVKGLRHYVMPDNVRSRRSLLKLGRQEEGLVDYPRVEHQQLVRYALSREAWQVNSGR